MSIQPQSLLGFNTLLACELVQDATPPRRPADRSMAMDWNLHGLHVIVLILSRTTISPSYLYTYTINFAVIMNCLFWVGIHGICILSSKFS
jgi:hypothetical protein